jgi:hypothetical protein
LAPAFQFVFSEFDAAIGHYRRYTRRSLGALRPPALHVVRSFYLDSPGLLLSLGNRALLHSHTPQPSQIAFWDRVVVPVARMLDPVLGRHFGRSVITVWERPNGPPPN